MNKIPLPVLIMSWLWPLSINAQPLFSDSFEYEGDKLLQYVDKISAEYFEDSPEAVQQRLLQYQKFAKQHQQQHSEIHRAIWYFIEGLNNLNIISALKQIQTEMNVDNQSEIEKYNTRLQQAFKKALSEDKKSNELTANMYSVMQRSLDDHLKIEAILKELELGGSGDSEASYWFKHWHVIGALKDAGRFNEAYQALNKMKQELNEAGLQKSAYAQLKQRAEQDLKNARSLSNTQSLAEESKSATRPRSVIEKLLGKYWPMILINGIMFTFIIIAGLKVYIKKR
jgi:hypothetical protein